jgi:hypothetical protein
MNQVVNYPATLHDLTLFADAAAELDGFKGRLTDNPVELARITTLVESMHDTVERIAGAASGMIYPGDDGPMFDYEAAKAFYFAKGANDYAGQGRFESAFYHTLRMVFEHGLKVGAATK